MMKPRSGQAQLCTNQRDANSDGLFVVVLVVESPCVVDFGEFLAVMVTNMGNHFLLLQRILALQ